MNEFDFNHWFSSLSPDKRKQLIHDAEQILEPEDFISKAKQVYSVALERFKEDVGMNVNPNVNYQRLEVSEGQVAKMLAFFEALGIPKEKITNNRWSAIISVAGKVAVVVNGEGTNTNPFVPNYTLKKEDSERLYTRLITGLSWENSKPFFFKLHEQGQLFLANEQGEKVVVEK